MRHAGITVIETFTTDQAVALCVSNRVDAVVLDQEFFVEIDGWSVAQSIKLVKPRICVLLATRARSLNDHLPKGVDAMVSHTDTKAILETLEAMTGHH
jgi:DNA-binding response OmpR family regulator